MLVVVAAGAVVVGAPEQWRDHTEHEGGGARRHGHGDYLFLGHGQRRPSQSSRHTGFAARRNFPWSRTPGYIAPQVVGAIVAAWFLRSMFGIQGLLGATTPGADVSNFKAFVMEVLLTTGLVSTILGTASGARNIGSNGALAVGGYIALAGLSGRSDERRLDEPRAFVPPRPDPRQPEHGLDLCRRPRSGRG